MTNTYLQIELRLLLLRHGRRAIVQALAELGEQTPEDVERELAAAHERKKKRKAAAPSPAELVAKACKDRPEIIELVGTLVTRFENRSFLPNLRDVVRFLDQAGYPHGRLRSRRKAVGHVVKALSQTSTDELRRLNAPPSSSGESDYALLAREIMGGDRGDPSTPHQR